jgi:hypothetical protein
MNGLKMKKQAALSIFLLGLASSFAYAVTLHSLNGAQFKQAFIDKTITSVATDNLNGRTIDNTFSMFMDDNGHIWGKMSHKPDNEPQIDKGTYTVEPDGTFYITWQHWDGSKKLCGHIFDTQNAYTSVDCNSVFHTAFMKENIKPGNVLS